MTPTPKSADEIIEEYIQEHNLVLNDEGRRKIDWLKSSMASVLLWAAEEACKRVYNSEDRTKPSHTFVGVETIHTHIRDISNNITKI